MKQFLVLLPVSLLVAGVGREQETPPVRPPTHQHAAYVAAEEGPPVTIFAQSDPRWRKARIRGRSLASVGCTVTSLASIARDAGYDTNPAKLARELARNGLFDAEGNLYGLREGTIQLRKVFPDLALTDRISANHRTLAREVRRALERGDYVMLKLNRDGGQHWVRAVGVDGADIRIMDPAGGRLDLLTDLYGSTRVMREAVFITKIG